LLNWAESIKPIRLSIIIEQSSVTCGRIHIEKR
jgi:hypothetical protein